MSWRGSTDAKDRFFAALVYVLPLIDVIGFGGFLFKTFPTLQLIYLPILPILPIYSSIPFAGLIIFFVLFAAVVRNYNISHFIRFNTMQALLIDIIISLFGLLLQILAGGLGGGLLVQTLSNVVFLAVWAGSLYAIIQSALGKYGEIPSIADVAYSQVGS